MVSKQEPKSSLWARLIECPEPILLSRLFTHFTDNNKEIYQISSSE